MKQRRAANNSSPSKRVVITFEGGEKEFHHDLDLGLAIPQMADKSDNKMKEKPKVAG